MDIEDLRILELTARLGSFTKAAEAVGLSKSALSRRIQLLEEHLDNRLLHRTTRNVKLTEAGEQAVAASRSLLDQLDELKQQLSKGRTVPKGKLRITAPVEFERLYLRQPVIKYLKMHPETDLQLLSNNQGLEMLNNESTDIAIIFGNPPDSGHIARKLGDVAVNFYASPDYLEKKGEPRSIEDLQHHDCIVEQYRGQQSRNWRYFENGELRSILVNDRYTSNATDLCRFLAENGMGVVWLPESLCTEALEQGKLVSLFDDRYLHPVAIYALYASKQFLPTKIKVFLDILSEAFPARL
jgi:DNA-binding transcriptional LysR family regulator